jgi:hypothetical protein
VNEVAPSRVSLAEQVIVIFGVAVSALIMYNFALLVRVVIEGNVRATAVVTVIASR